MSQINKIIRELWRATYKGNDIDYIEIKTDDYDPTAGADKRQVCNYRVIMVKQSFLVHHDVINLQDNYEKSFTLNCNFFE
jgi:hypothetical protein